MTNSVTHFEIYGDDPANLADFYRSLFGWRINQAPGIEYWQIQTGSADTNSAFDGGLLYRPIPGPRSWVHYVKVESLDETLTRVQRLGGSIVMPKAAVPKTAWYAIAADPQGNIFAVWQPDPAAMPPPEPD